MKYIILFNLIFVLAFCKREMTDHSTENYIEKETQKSDKKDSGIISNDISKVSKQPTSENKKNLSVIPKKNFRKKTPAKEQFSRYVEFYNDLNYNGRALIYQIDLKKETLNNNPDTLKVLLKDIYEMSKPRFVVSVADDFENGIAREYVHYPQLKYTFQVFEDEFQEIPYQRKTYTIKKDQYRTVIIE